MKDKLELRMYGLVNYQLTGIQKGIQFLHAVVEYNNLYNNEQLYKDWSINNKTVILLNGGTTNKREDENGLPLGSLNQHLLTLHENGIDLATFQEPDLGDQLTAIAFIVDERVFNKKKYLDFPDWLLQNYNYNSLKIDGDFFTSGNITDIIMNSDIKDHKKIYKRWEKYIGGEKNVFLRDFLKNFRLA